MPPIGAILLLFCEREGQGSLPASPETLACYVTWLKDVQGRKTGTLTRRLSAISQAHQAVGYSSPTQEVVVRRVMAGIRRKHGTEPKSKAPLVPEILKLLLAQIPKAGARALRDRALLLFGFAGGFRRSELVALQMDHLEAAPDGILVKIKRSKGDQEGATETIGIPVGRYKETCPVRALNAWIEAGKIEKGLLFRSTAPWTEEILETGLEGKRVATLIRARPVSMQRNSVRTRCAADSPRPRRPAELPSAPSWSRRATNP